MQGQKQERKRKKRKKLQISKNIFFHLLSGKKPEEAIYVGPSAGAS